MLLAAGLALWRGWQLHRGEGAVIAFGLGVLALALGVWRLTRHESTSRKHIVGKTRLTMASPEETTDAHFV